MTGASRTQCVELLYTRFELFSTGQGSRRMLAYGAILDSADCLQYRAVLYNTSIIVTSRGCLFGSSSKHVEICLFPPSKPETSPRRAQGDFM